MYRDYPATKILHELDRHDLLPAILFRTSRRQCDEDIVKLSESKYGSLPVENQNKIKDVIEATIRKYGMDREILTDHLQFEALIKTGAGAHHAGQLLMWRLLLEELMSQNTLRLMIATGTVAAGVDFPARTVVITAHSKRGAEGFQVLTASEFQQMSGRAGRRGKDSVGLCLVAPGPFSDARVFHEVADKPPEPLRSAYFAAPATVLNLLKYRSVEELRYLTSKSLASFLDRKSAEHIKSDASEKEQDLLNSEHAITQVALKKGQKRIRRLLRDAELLEAKQETALNLSLDGLGRLKHLDERGLTEKGLWAAQLCTNLVLHLAEIIEEGVFYDIDPLRLAAFVGSIAGDSHRAYFSLSKNPFPAAEYKQIEEIVVRVNENYNGPTTASDVRVLPDAALTVTTWMECEDWSSFSSLLRLAGVASGDAARLISQTADHLHQISRLQESHPPLVETAIEARKQLLRPPLIDTVLVE